MALWEPPKQKRPRGGTVNRPLLMTVYSPGLQERVRCGVTTHQEYSQGQSQALNPRRIVENKKYPCWGTM